MNDESLQEKRENLEKIAKMSHFIMDCLLSYADTHKYNNNIAFKALELVMISICVSSDVSLDELFDELKRCHKAINLSIRLRNGEKL